MLVFEKSVAGRRAFVLDKLDVPVYELKAERRAADAELPELAELDVVRHYTELSRKAYGVDNGFYPLGSCTMKYNPRLNERVAAFEGFAGIHPLQPDYTVKGCREVIDRLSDSLCKVTGMDAFTLQPAAGAHGEFVGIMLIKAYHLANKQLKRNKIIVPDSSHGTNPASANMCGYEVITVPSNERGGLDIAALEKAVGDDTAGLMLTNPNTLGLFDENILKITEIVHKAGGLCYYDGANLNAIMGIVRPGDMGFDVVHLNIHKTFSTPHGGGGPGAGAVGCKAFLSKYLPLSGLKSSIGRVMCFYGNFNVLVKGLTYILTLGADGLKDASQKAVLNANYMRVKMSTLFDVAKDRICMHEFVLTLENFHNQTGVSAMDISKAILDCGMHPPTMYFPLIVHEALMFEPTETESRETIDDAVEKIARIKALALESPETLHQSPLSTQVGRADEVLAARRPVLRWKKGQ